MSKDASITSLEQLLQALAAANGVVLVDFGASWCAPCRALLPLLEQLQHESNGSIRLLAIDADNADELVDYYSIRTLPTVLVFSAGNLCERIVGMHSMLQLKAFLAPYLHHECLPSGADTYDSAHAISHFRDAAHNALHIPEAQLPFLLALCEEGGAEALNEALAHIEALRFDVQRHPEISLIHTRLGWLIRSVDPHDELARVYCAAGEGDFKQAMELLFKHQTSDRVRDVIVELLNAMPDREMANLYRRKLFSVD